MLQKPWSLRGEKSVANAAKIVLDKIYIYIYMHLRGNFSAAKVKNIYRYMIEI